MSEYDLLSDLPERLRGLAKLAYNLWWSWTPEARDLFRSMSLRAWREHHHNPVQMLALRPPGSLERLMADDHWMDRYDSVMARFEPETSERHGWFPSEFGQSPGPIAYFSAEYGLHVSLPVYAGGLGILAGDFLKECSDLGVPIVGVGLFYAQGYVRQIMREDGWQEDVEAVLDRRYDPITQVYKKDGQPLLVQVPLFDPPVYVNVWKVAVGRICLYLMDTNLEANQPWDRAIAQRLYTSDPEQRLRQEIVLGMGGMRMLEALGIKPVAQHLNEGHPALAIFERIAALVQDGASYDQASQRVKASTIFTTHTPVAAGTDIFPFPLMDRYFGGYYEQLALDRDRFMQLGVNPQDPGAGFNMTALALRMADYRNGVSQKHASVARKIWGHLWPDLKEEEVPIVGITNGVHLPSWVEPTRLVPLFERYLGPAWWVHQDLPGIWERVDEIPDEELWHVHQDLKVTLVTRINERARSRWQQDRVAASNVIGFGALLNPEVLTIGFARRFTPYKRADLIFHNIERLKALLGDTRRPIQIVFAGKAHPADQEGKYLAQRIFRMALEPEFGGRIAFVENYDQQVAKYLVHGVDIWLNNPMPPLEASGTSGMKAGVNGTPNLSILDGWWIEGYNGSNGWAFGGEEGDGDRTIADAEALYKLIEDTIRPLYYHRPNGEVPHAFVQVMKASIKSIAPRFSATRMVKDYINQFYLKALGLKE